MAQDNSSQKTTNLFAAIAFTILITASATFTLTEHFRKPPTIDTILSENPAEIGKQLRYFNDSLTLSGKTPEGTDLLLNLDLYRKELTEGQFLHYYLVHYWNGTEDIKDYTSFKSDTFAVQPNDFLSQYNIRAETDLSTREYLDFTVKLGNRTISSSNFHNLQGDFITKNDLNFTRYLSTSKADVNIGDNQIFQVHAALEKAYAADHSKLVYFPDFQNLSSRTYRFIVWDDQDNFFLIDDSLVNEQNPYYKTHTWVLHQNAAGQNQKSFYAPITFREEDGTKYWQIEIPKFFSTLKLQTSYPTKENWVEGPITGTLEKSGKTTNLAGTFSYKKE